MLLVVYCSGDYHARAATKRREPQIVLVELFAAVLALDQLPPEECGKSIILSVDSEPAESAFIKGYSARHERLGGVLLGTWLRLGITRSL